MRQDFLYLSVMKTQLTIILTLIFNCAFSQGKPLESFIPKGCKILATANGDLNNDKQEDVALVVQEPTLHRDPKKADAYEKDIIALHPQTLLILFKAGNGYVEKVRNKVFIPSKNIKEYPDSEDYLVANDAEAFYIKKGVLRCTFNYYSNLSLWANSEETYSFALKSNDMALTRYRCYTIHSSDGLAYEKVIDFEKGTVTNYEKVTDFEKGTATQTKPAVTLKLKNKKPILLKSMVNAIADSYNYDFENK